MRHPATSSIAPVPNVTPMIDVMLVLLCIFMVVTPMLADGTTAIPPEGEHLQERPEEPTDHTLAIDAAGRFTLDRAPIDAARLPTALRVLYPSGATDRVLFLRAHRELPYGQVRAALAVARENGVAVVGLVTEQKRR